MKQELQDKEKRKSSCNKSASNKTEIGSKRGGEKQELPSCSLNGKLRYSGTIAKHDNQNRCDSFKLDNDKKVKFAHSYCIVSLRKKHHKKHRLCKSFNSDMSDEQEATDSSTSSASWILSDKNGRQGHRKSILPSFLSTGAIQSNGRSLKTNIDAELCTSSFWKTEQLKLTLGRKKSTKKVHDNCYKSRYDNWK